MLQDSDIPLIGGTNHGQRVQVDENTGEIEMEIHTTDPPIGEPVYTETYERRRFDGDGFGEGLECFVLKSDDSIEQKELARWTASHTPNLANKEDSA